MANIIGPWEYIPSNEHHGAYVVDAVGLTVCDFYVMSQPGMFSARNGGLPEPRPFAYSDERARLTAAAPDLLEACQALMAERDQLVERVRAIVPASANSTDSDASILARTAIAKATTDEERS